MATVEEAELEDLVLGRMIRVPNNLDLRLLFQTIVPIGEYHSSFSDDQHAMTPSQYAAMKRSRELGQWIAQEHPEIAEMYRDTTVIITYLDIGRIILPVEAGLYPGVVSKAVGYAMRQLIEHDELEELTRRHKAKGLESRLANVPVEELKDAWSAGARKRNKEYGTAYEAMVRARGQIPYSDEEKRYIFSCLTDEMYIIRRGELRIVNYDRIANELNDKFHGGLEVRTSIRLSNWVRDYNRKQRNLADRGKTR